MRNAFHILLITLLLMAGCGRPAETTLLAELQRAEDIMNEHPDSALSILQGMTPPVDELNHATWALFTTQAKYKLFMTQSDSLLNIAFPYFMAKGDAQRRAMVLYYRAALYHEENKMEEAQEYYLKATDEIEKTDNYELAHLIYTGLGNVYSHALPDHALEYYMKAKEYAIKSNKSRFIRASHVYLARIYGKKNNYQEAIHHYQIAISIAKSSNEPLKLIAAQKELASILIRIKDYNSALKYMKEIEKTEKEHSLKLGEHKYLTLARIYDRLNQADSAIIYLNKALESTNIYTLKGSYSSLYYAYKNKNNYKPAAEYLEKAWILQDSISSIEKSQALIEMQEKYDEQRVRDEMNTKMALQQQRTWMAACIGIVIIIAISSFIAYRIRIRNKERITRLAEAEDRIETLNRMLEEAQKATSADEKDSAFIKRILLQQLGVIRLVANTPTAQNQALLRRLTEIGNEEAPAEELIVWEDLYPIIDRLYDNFHTRLMERFGSLLTEKEVQTCCLLCAGFSTKEIAIITRQAVATVYTRKTTSRQKMGAPEGADIVEWVKKEELQ